jgi:hypothetical protein
VSISERSGPNLYRDAFSEIRALFTSDGFRWLSFRLGIVAVSAANSTSAAFSMIAASSRNRGRSCFWSVVLSQLQLLNVTFPDLSLILSYVLNASRRTLFNFLVQSTLRGKDLLNPYSHLPG